MSAGAAAGAPAAGGGDASHGLAQDGNGNGGAQAGADFSALADQLGQLSEGQQQMRDFLQRAPWQQQQEAGELDGEEGEFEGEGEELDFSELDDVEDVEGWEPGGEGFGPDPNEIPGVNVDDPQAVAEHLSQRLDAAVNEGVYELSKQLYSELDETHEAIANERQLREMTSLVQEFPELGDPEVSQRVLQASHAYVEARGWPAELAADPGLWRIFYMAGRAADAGRWRRRTSRRWARIWRAAVARTPAAVARARGTSS